MRNWIACRLAALPDWVRPFVPLALEDWSLANWSDELDTFIDYWED